ncbi:MAG: outer membrane protein OmpA-like peptidoglycan-associated protein, partial [Patiriisocius sp.]
QLYVTRNNVKRGRATKDNTGRVNLKVYVFDELEGGEWSEGTDVAFNSNDYSVAHPSISSDGNLVYFSSNQVGGYGGTDIYVSKRKENGEWGDALNLGPQINTEGDESFPFIMNSGTLYFSSDGHPGLGGLDIFKAVTANGKWMNPINLAHPINSEKDDISFVSEADEKSGYFSSNRLENQVGDDIYAFKYTPLIKVNAFVRDKYTLLPIEGVIAKIYDESGFVIFEGVSDENGYLEVSTIKGKCNYKMTIEDGMGLSELEYDLSLCDEENSSKEIIDLGYIEFGGNDYSMSLTAEDKEKSEIIADVYTKIYDLETKELMFESLIAENGNLEMALEPDRVYRVDVSHDDYEIVSREFRTSEDVNVRDIDLSVSMLENGISNDSKYSIALTAEDVSKNELVADVYTKIYDLETKELIFESLVAENGIIALALQPDRDYRVDVSNDDYKVASREFRTSEDENVRDLDVAVSMFANEKVEGLALGNIYYDFDKSDIRSDAKVVLDELVTLMSDNPEVKIDMSSHTDSRGSNAYNMALSDRRENSAMNYLISAGIDASRLSTSHHGEEQLVNICANNVKCAENEHQLNRRTSIIITNPDVLESNQVDEDALDLAIALELDTQFDNLDQSDDQNDELSSSPNTMYVGKLS